jgi:nucleoside-diphosphate-sugar epimerase
MVAVTGANGLLGSFIVRELIKNNTPFVALKRKNSDISLLSDINHLIVWKDADIMDTLSLEDALEGVTKVIHAAAAVSFNPRKSRYVFDINVVGTRNVVNSCIEKGVQRLVHISSVAALGRQKNQTVIDESNQWVDSPLNSVYAKSKYLAELEVFRGEEEGLHTVMINPSVILAPADWNKSSAQLFKYVWDKNLFLIDGYLNYVDVRDVAYLTCALLESHYRGERFIANAGKIEYKVFFNRIAELFHKRAPFIQLSPRVLQVAARLEVLRTWFTGSEPLLSPETARLAGTDFLFKNEKIKSSFSFTFQPIDNTLAWCCQSYMTKFTGKKS